jgi:hypothetical protein
MNLKQQADIWKSKEALEREDQELRQRTLDLATSKAQAEYGDLILGGQGPGTERQKIEQTGRQLDITGGAENRPFSPATYEIRKNMMTSGLSMKGIDPKVVRSAFAPVDEILKPLLADPKITKGVAYNLLTDPTTYNALYDGYANALKTELEKGVDKDPNFINTPTGQYLVNTMQAVELDREEGGLLKAVFGDVLQERYMKQVEAASKIKQPTEWSLALRAAQGDEEAQKALELGQEAKAEGRAPFSTALPTSQGYMAFDTRTQETKPIIVGGQRIMPHQADVGLAGAKAGAVKTAQEEAERLAELKKTMPKVRESLISAERQWDNVDKIIDKTLSQISPFTAGLGAWTSIIPTTTAKDLKNNLNSIKANIGFDKLQDMRQNSPTGGALGQVSDMENRLLQAVQGSLEQDQSPKQLIDNLINIKGMLNQLRSQKQFAFDYDFREVRPQQKQEQPQKTVVERRKTKTGKILVKYSDGTIGEE